MIHSVRSLLARFRNLYTSRPALNTSREKVALITLLFACDQTLARSSDQKEQRLVNLLLDHQLLLGTSEPAELIGIARKQYEKIGNPYLVINQAIPFIRESYRPLMLFYVMTLLWADGNITNHKDHVLEYVKKALAISDEDMLDLMEVALVQMPINQTIIELVDL